MESLIGAINDNFKSYSPFALIVGTIITSWLSSLLYKLLTTPVDDIKESIVRRLVSIAKAVPITAGAIQKEEEKTIKKLREDLHKDLGVEDFTELPEKGIPKEKVLEMLQKFKKQEDPTWKAGKVSGAVYYEEHMIEFLNQVYCMYSTSNALHPDVWPSLRKFESEIIRMAIKMLNGTKDCCGVITSGGSESILMAVKAARDYGMKVRGIKRPEVIIPITAHAAFEKASDYFSVKLIKVGMDKKSLKADLNAIKKAITSNTVMIVASAPNYPHGIVDDVEAIAKIGREKGIWVHVDACLGGFFLPWLRKIEGSEIPPFDFSVPGVISISADTHKYGFAQKGTSTVLFAHKKYRKHMYFVSTDWPGGLYASPSMPGSRPGGVIAVCWAALLSLGKDGYSDSIKRMYLSSRKILAGLKKFEDIEVMGDPKAMVIAFTSDKFNIYAVSDAMHRKGWHLNSLHRPNGVHLCVTNRTVGNEEQFLTDLAACVEEVKANKDLAKQGNAPIYGLASSFPDRGAVKDLVTNFLDILLETKEDY